MDSTLALIVSIIISAFAILVIYLSPVFITTTKTQITKLHLTGREEVDLVGPDNANLFWFVQVR